MAETAENLQDEKVVETTQAAEAPEAVEAPAEEEKFAKSGKKSKKYIFLYDQLLTLLKFHLIQRHLFFLKSLFY